MRVKIFILFFLFSYCYSVFAQMDTINMKAVEINADRSSSIYPESFRIVSIISKNEIENLPSQSLQDVLKYALNVDVRERGPQGVQADISIRGGSFDQLLILLNGINMNDPQTGHYNLDLPILIDQIDHIEILEGPGARVYGNNAFAGAINIVTDSPDKSHVKLSGMYGEHGLYTASFAGNMKAGKTNNYVAFSNKASQGYIKNTDFDITNVFVHQSTQFGIGKMDVQAGYQSKAYGANSFYTPMYPDQYEKTKTYLANIKFTGGKKLQWIPSIYWKRHQDRFELFRYAAPSWYKGHNYHLTDVAGGDLQLVYFYKIGKTRAGVNYRKEEIHSNVLGDLTNDTMDVPGEPDGFFNHYKQRTNFSAFVDQCFYLKKFTFSIGAMANWNSQYEFSYYPGIDVSFLLSKSIKLYASANKSMRLPTFTDLYYSSPTNTGNPSLNPEEAVTYETGIKLANNYMDAHLAVFRRYGENIIDWVKTSTNAKWESKNITKLTIDGIEVSDRINFNKLIGSKFFINYINLSYCYLNGNKYSGNYISKYAMDYLHHSFDVQLQHKIIGKVGACWTYAYNQREGSYSDYVLQKEEPYPPFSLFNLRVFYNKSWLYAYVEVSNLFNQSYVDMANVPMAGRWSYIGVVMDLNFTKK